MAPKNEKEVSAERSYELAIWREGVLAEATTLANKKISEYITTNPATKPADPDPFEEKTPKASVFQVIEAADFAGGEHAEPEWQIHQLVPFTGTGLNTGASQTLKSFEILEVGTCINRGTPYQGLPVRNRSRCNYCCGRSEAQATCYACGHLLEGRSAMSANCRRSFPRRRTCFMRSRSSSGLVELQYFCATYVAFDTKFRCSVGAEENSAKDMAVVFGAMERISGKLLAASLPRSVIPDCLDGFCLLAV